MPVEKKHLRDNWMSGSTLSILLHITGDQFGLKSVPSYEGKASQAPRLVVQLEH